MRHRLRTLAVAALLAAPVLAHAAPIKCKNPGVGIEAAICASPQLRATDQRISDAYDQLLSHCGSDKAARLRQAQLFWIRDRNFCWNGPEITGKPIETCVADRMAERLEQFGRIGPACDLDAVAAEYRFVDPGYMLQLGNRYVGRKVTVAGQISMNSCDVNSPDVAGYLAMPGKKDRSRYPVTFKSMPAREREFLCAQGPFSHWTGTVRQGKQGTYLYLEDVLGSPLP